MWLVVVYILQYLMTKKARSGCLNPIAPDKRGCHKKNANIFWLKKKQTFSGALNHGLLNPDSPAFANNVDPDQLAYWSGSALFKNKYVNLYQNPRSSNLIDWKLEEGVAS